MGCSQPQNAAISNIAPQHLNRFLQIADINHHLNVNKKYEHLTRINQKKYVGSGFKKVYDLSVRPMRTNAQQPERSLSQNVDNFETRVNGSPQCWGAIRIAVQQLDQNTGLAILQSARLTMLNNSIQMVIDNRMNKYELPVFCLNDPISYSKETIAEKNLNYNYDDKTFEVRIRSVKYPTADIVINQKASTDIATIKRDVINQKSLENMQIRFFYNGREMIDSKTLGNYNYIAGTVIQAMIN